MQQRVVMSVLLFLLTSALHTRSFANTCDALLEIKSPDIRMTDATLVANPSTHCKARGLIGEKIGFSLWLPLDWNGRFVMGGAGGFVRPEDNQALRLIGDYVLTQGYATASTDTGHQGEGQDGSWALNDLEAIVNYGHLGMHRAVVASKTLIQAHYGKSATRSFFVGCSNGGRQALHEAQRYPGDFDGIVAGAPALNFTSVAAAFLNITSHMYPDANDLSQPLVTSSHRQYLRAAIETECDAADGIADGILNEPNACDVDLESLSCNVKTQSCIPPAALAAIRSVYTPPPVGDGRRYFGFPYGAEDVDANGWGSWLTGGTSDPASSPNAAFSFGVGMMRYFIEHDPGWRHTSLDWRAYSRRVAPVAAVLNADNPDLAAFRARGGKLLMYHGWADVALSANMSTDYVDRVYAHDARARDDVRLFMMPGVLHCYDGDGPSIVNWLETIERWHATGIAPDHLAAGYPAKPGQRKLCAWPTKAVYTSGNTEASASYTCK